MFPKISIVTINRNNSIGLRKTIQSVLSQTYSNIEYIIIDGNSSDASVNEIKTVENRLTYWISEPDKGLYNAMNKGLAKATGNYVLFLNSADYFHDDFVIEKLVAAADNADMIYGNLCILKGGKIHVLKSAPIIHYHERYQHNLPPHPAILIRRQLINELGGLDEDYKIIADVVLISKLFASKEHKYKFLDIPITVFDISGISSNPENQEEIYQERRRFIQDEFPEYLIDFEKIYKERSITERVIDKIKILFK